MVGQIANPLAREPETGVTTETQIAQDVVHRSPPMSKAILLMPTLLELIRILVRSSAGPARNVTDGVTADTAMLPGCGA